ncbi:MAG: formylglycine-generating enzyme family protein [Desulfobacterales bacterium]|nr:formylglycine-generating enzyme family protein [Desulfobacterales bacterium]
MKKIILIIITILLFACENKPKQKIVNPLGMTFVYIESGSYVMGPKSQHYASQPREVTLTKGFYIQTTETTITQWREFIKKTGYKTSAEIDGFGWSKFKKKYYYEYKNHKKIKGLYWNNPGYKFTEKHPVSMISWNDTLKFISWLNKTYGVFYRLPTEAEWEYACRAGTNTHFYNGNLTKKGKELGYINDSNLDKIAWYGYNSSGSPQPVGLKKPNKWGLYDMYGNVKEFCQDNFKLQIPIENVKDPLIIDKSIGLVAYRGGAWDDIPATSTSSSRGGIYVKKSTNLCGFRLVKDVAPEDYK